MAGRADAPGPDGMLTGDGQRCTLPGRAGGRRAASRRGIRSARCRPDPDAREPAGRDRAPDAAAGPAGVRGGLAGAGRATRRPLLGLPLPRRQRTTTCWRRRDGVVRRGAGALLRRPAADRAGLAAPPGRHRRPRLPRHGQQRGRARPRAPAGRGRGRPAAAAAEHQLAVQLRRGRRVLRAAGRDCCPSRWTPSSWSTPAPRRSTWRCGWPWRPPGAGTWSRCGRPTTAGRTPSDAVSTSTADNPNALSTRPAWVHTVDAPNSYRGRYRGAEAAPVRRRGRRSSSTSSRRSGRPPAAFICRAVLRQRRRHAAARRLPGRRSTPRSGAAAGSPSPTRSRSATAASATGSGDSSSRAWCPTSSPSPRRRATATRSARSSPPAPIAERYRDAGLLLLLDRRQPGRQRRRADRARRAPATRVCRTTPPGSART